MHHNSIDIIYKNIRTQLRRKKKLMQEIADDTSVHERVKTVSHKNCLLEAQLSHPNLK